MRIKVFTAATTSDLEMDVNKFISKRDIDVINLDYTTVVTGHSHMAYTVMITYNMHGLVEENEEAL
jgi:hypothetical protein